MVLHAVQAVKKKKWCHSVERMSPVHSTEACDTGFSFVQFYQIVDSVCPAGCVKGMACACCASEYSVSSV